MNNLCRHPTNINFGKMSRDDELI